MSRTTIRLSAKDYNNAITPTQLNSQVQTNSNRNLIINGDMSIAQRTTPKASISDQTSGYYTGFPDRWAGWTSDIGTYTQSQETDAPAGFTKSLKLLMTTQNDSLEAGDYGVITQRIEGLNLQHLQWGTGTAKPLTLSFWVKGGTTGTYICEFLRDESTDRSISASYTINAQATWEKKTITIAGDTTTAITNDNANRLAILWGFGLGSNFTSGTLATSWGNRTTANTFVGQTNITGDTSGSVNYIQLAGVQLEVGEVATSFENESYERNLARCQRYYQSWTNAGLSDGVYAVTPYANRSSLTAPNTSASNQFWLRTSMRGNPACVASGTGTGFNRISGNTEVVTAQYSSTTEDNAMGFGGFTADAEL